jgi:DNA polymerase III alpha subunit
VHEARKCGGKVHAPEINKSEHLTFLYGDDIYLGFHLLAGLENQTVIKILEERRLNGEFSSLENFMRRVSIAVEQLRILIRVGAFRFSGRTKKQLLWDIHAIIGAGKKTEVRTELFQIAHKEFTLPELHYGRLDDAFDELEILGFPLCSPFKLLKELPGEMICCADELKNHLGKIISITGYSVTRKNTSTKKGEAMAFGTFLDVNGKWIDTTHFPDVLKQYPFRGKACYMITGKVVEEFGFYSIDVTAMERLDFQNKYEEEIKITPTESATPNKFHPTNN